MAKLEVIKPKQPEPDKEIISALEKLHASAKDGKLRSLIAIYDTEDSITYYYRVAPDDEWPAFQVIHHITEDMISGQDED